MSNLQKILNFCIEQKESYDKPASYCQTEYYIKCKAKSELLNDLINEIQTLIKEKIR